MLASLAAGNECAYPAYIYLKDAHSTKINWASFFTWIQMLLTSYQQNV
jgi:hypothetical protein